MEKKLNDYINLYLGCKCLSFNELEYELKPSNLPENWQKTKINHKPILRRLADMTEEEKGEFEVYQLRLMQEDYNQLERNSFKTKWYLDRHFDLFGLIQAELAYDAKDLQAQGSVATEEQ